MLRKIFTVPFADLIIRIVVGFSLIVCIFYFVAGFDFGNLTTSFYSVQDSHVQNPVRIVMLSDLHLREFGKDNSKLLEKVETLKPDIIAAVGDFTIYKNPKHEVALKLLNDLNEIAPVYFSFGNHEFSEILFTEGSKLRSELEDTDAVILNKTYKKINVNGTDITIGGFCVSPKDFDKQNKEFLQKFTKQGGYKVLLCHHVECFEDMMNDYPVDLALCGHAHGGQFVLPLIGPVYAPYQGFFPKLTEGMHELCGSTVVISRGLGNSHHIPRYNNDPEIVVIDISSI